MATAEERLMEWLRDAHAAEEQAETMLSGLAGRIENYPQLKARLEKLEEWIGYASPDIVCLQETKMADAAFPTMAFTALGYESAHHGEGRWNGVAVAVRVARHRGLGRLRRSGYGERVSSARSSGEGSVERSVSGS